ncbi:unnamed protein product, partial [Prunus brigantina]
FGQLSLFLLSFTVAGSSRPLLLNSLSLSLSLSLCDAVVFLFHCSPAKGNSLYEYAHMEAMLEVLYMVIHNVGGGS